MNLTIISGEYSWNDNTMKINPCRSMQRRELWVTVGHRGADASAPQMSSKLIGPTNRLLLCLLADCNFAKFVCSSGFKEENKLRVAVFSSRNNTIDMKLNSFPEDRALWF